MHYTLGFSPNRTGGLVKYSTDLMLEQVRRGDIVFALYPGMFGILKKETKIIKKNRIDGINVYELFNPLPIALRNGICSPKKFMTKAKIEVYTNFLKLVSPEIIHVHTLMGIHKEFFDAARKLNIKVVFTTHDYFGLAPEPTFYFEGINYFKNNDALQWERISTGAFPLWKLRIFQFPFYYKLKKILRFINEKLLFLKSFKNKPEKKVVKESLDIQKEFSELKKYYLEIFHEIDFFHFNSSLSKKVYLSFLVPRRYRVLSISNSNIHNFNLKKIKKNNGVLNIAYIGPYENYKGFYDFIKFAKRTSLKSKFHVWGDDKKIVLPSKILNHGRFNSNQLKSLYMKTDVIVVPSLWMETFGFVTMEALSYGCCVFVSKNVGSKDLVKDEFIFKDIDELEFKINNIDRFIFKPQKTMSENASEIKDIYVNLIKNNFSIRSRYV